MPHNKQSPYTYLSMTVSVCPTCHRSLAASISERDGKIYMRKTCPEHGRFVTLIASNAELYAEARAHTSPTYLLSGYQTETRAGCPQDCGVCPEHEQNNTAPVIEITNRCNLDCPICFAGEQTGYQMSAAEMDACLNVIEASGTDVDVLIITGGEPTAHPQLLALIDQAQARPFIPRVAVATNGVLLAKRDALVAALAERGVNVILQLDSADPQKVKALRGRELGAIKAGALAALERHRVPTTILMTVVGGLNDDEMGDLLRLSLSKDFVTGFEAQTIAYTGTGGRTVPFDPLTRVTGTDLIERMEAQSDGLLRRTDFMPMPHPHPNCIALAYLLKLVDGSFVPFARFTEPEVHRSALFGHFIAKPEPRHESFIHDVIDYVWGAVDEIEKGPVILETLKALLSALYPSDRPLSEATRLELISSYVRNVFLHAVMDDHSLDAEVLRKCTSMQVLPDGRMIPHCSYRVLHRASDPRWQATGAPSLGHGLDGARQKLISLE